MRVFECRYVPVMLQCRECIYLSVTFDIEHMSIYDEIPENYDLRKIVHALIKELASSAPSGHPVIDTGAAMRIIEKGRPKS